MRHDAQEAESLSRPTKLLCGMADLEADGWDLPLIDNAINTTISTLKVGQYSGAIAV